MTVKRSEVVAGVTAGGSLALLLSSLLTVFFVRRHRRNTNPLPYLREAGAL
ncbi:MAG TPA: hypothetical protein VK473_11090 [Terriglobales bacterium]|nr:hypothetical protein [Terriglobales bacterium]